LLFLKLAVCEKQTAEAKPNSLDKPERDFLLYVPLTKGGRGLSPVLRWDYMVEVEYAAMYLFWVMTILTAF
jgi:hypothetical protein